VFVGGEDSAFHGSLLWSCRGIIRAVLGSKTPLGDAVVLHVDTAANRRAAKYGRWERLARVAWMLAGPLFRWSPRPFFAWRRALLRIFGARIGRRVHIYNSAIIYLPWNLVVGEWSAIGERALIYNLGKVTVGRHVTISHQAHLCAGTHDHRRPDLPLLKPPIQVADQAWICADAFVGPGVSVGEGAVIGARAVVTRDVKAWQIVAGNPARAIGKRRLIEQEPAV
jgi:putative colanic acid biosynthesis acetyltransferase WcaF